MTKLKNLIEQARREGITVRVRRESDGSGETRVRVVSINGKAYSKSKGNTALRVNVVERALLEFALAD